MKYTWLLIFILFIASWNKPPQTIDPTSWIRINLLGYKPSGIKVAVWCSKEEKAIQTFQLIDSASNKIVFEAKAGKNFGAYGPFSQTYRLNFSSYKKPGKYYLRSGNAVHRFLLLMRMSIKEQQIFVCNTCGSNEAGLIHI